MSDLLSDILTRLSLRGALYFRTCFTPPWGVAVPAYENVARFHYAHRGECRVTLDDGPETRLEEGDLAIIPHGAAHVLHCRHSAAKDALPLERVLAESGYDGRGVLMHGGGEPHDHTHLICGHFSFESAGHPLLRRMPPLIRIAGYGAQADEWMQSALRMIGAEAGRERAGGDLIALKISEAVFAMALRAFLESPQAEESGLAGYADPRLARALAAFHADPARDWSVASLAREAGASRTIFAELFSRRMGETPMRYVAAWRMQRASAALAQGCSLAETAALVGYASESAFARSFRREIGRSPAAWRRAARAAE